MDQDLEHIRLLSVFHYVVGGIAALFSCFPFIHLAVGIALLNGAMQSGYQVSNNHRHSWDGSSSGLPES